jgi:hypothetical protein
VAGGSSGLIAIEAKETSERDEVGGRISHLVWYTSRKSST